MPGEENKLMLVKTKITIQYIYEFKGLNFTKVATAEYAGEMPKVEAEVKTDFVLGQCHLDSIEAVDELIGLTVESEVKRLNKLRSNVAHGFDGLTILDGRKPEDVLDGIVLCVYKGTALVKVQAAREDGDLIYAFWRKDISRWEIVKGHDAALAQIDWRIGDKRSGEKKEGGERK